MDLFVRAVRYVDRLMRGGKKNVLTCVVIGRESDFSGDNGRCGGVGKREGSTIFGEGTIGSEDWIGV